MLAALHPGASYHCEALERPRYGGLFDRLIRPEGLDDASLAGADTLLVPCRTSPRRMAPHRDRLVAFLRGGGTLVAMGETFQDLWLPEVRLVPVETNYWWWLAAGADLGVRVVAPHHPLMAGLTTTDVS